MMYMLLCGMVCTQMITAKAEEIAVDVSATAYIVMDNESGNILLEKNAQERIEPASLTKIMTAIIVVENTRNFDRMITFTKSDMEYVNKTGASKIGLMEVGDQLSIEDALYGLMLSSGGDCAMMLSHSVTGTSDEFVELMNKKAEAIGLQNTQFQNALGVSENGQYSTAEDIAKLLQYAMKNAHVKELMATTSYTLRPTLSDPIEIAHSAKVMFTNALLPYDSIVAAKTGFEIQNGHCLAALVERDDKEVLSVVIGSGMKKEENYSAEDTKKLTDFVFDQTKTIQLSVEQLQQETIVLHTNRYDVQDTISFLVDKEADETQFHYTYHKVEDDTVFVGKQVGELEVGISEEEKIFVPIYVNKVYTSKKNLILYGVLLVIAALYFTYQHNRHQAILKGEKAHG